MDKRTEYTRKMIKSAFLEALKHKDYGNISVAELCRAAEINRSTFYKHYHRIDDVLDDVLEDVVREVDTVFDQLDLENCVCGRALCQFIRNSGEYQPLFLDNGLSDYIIAKMSKYYSEDYLAHLSKETVTPHEAQQLFWFQMHGCLAVVRRNLSKSDDAWMKIKCAVDGFIQRGLSER